MESFTEMRIFKIGSGGFNLGGAVNFLRGCEADLYLQAKVQGSKTASSYCKKGAVVQHMEQVYVSRISTILFVILFLDL